MAKPGRPRGSTKAGTRNIVFAIRLSEKERKLIRKRARSAGNVPTIWMRSIILAELSSPNERSS